MAALGVPSLTRAAEVPAPTLLNLNEAPTPARVELRIDAEDLGREGEPLAMKIAEVAGEVMGEEGFGEASDPMDPSVVIVIERTGTAEQPGYVVGLSVEKGEEVVAGSVRQVDCSLCTRGELIEKIEGELPELLELARAHQVPVEVGGGEDGGEDGDGGGEGGDEDGGDGGGEDVKAIGPLGFAGIGVGVLGAVGVGVGAGLVGVGVVPQEPTLERANDFRPPGAATLVAGGVALVAGVVMIVVDVSKRKKAQRSSEKAKVELRGAGIAF